MLKNSQIKTIHSYLLKYILYLITLLKSLMQIGNVMLYDRHFLNSFGSREILTLRIAVSSVTGTGGIPSRIFRSTACVAVNCS